MTQAILTFAVVNVIIGAILVVSGVESNKMVRYVLLSILPQLVTLLCLLFFLKEYTP